MDKKNKIKKDMMIIENKMGVSAEKEQGVFCLQSKKVWWYEECIWVGRERGNQLNGSHPFWAGKPIELQPLELPLMISFNPNLPVWYNQGFKNPRDGSPRERLKSFNKLMTEAKVGAAADVPPTEKMKKKRKSCQEYIYLWWMN